MRKKRPQFVTLGDVRISRKNDGALIEYRDPGIASVHLELGSDIQNMTD